MPCSLARWKLSHLPSLSLSLSVSPSFRLEFPTFSRLSFSLLFLYTHTNTHIHTCAQAYIHWNAREHVRRRSMCTNAKPTVSPLEHHFPGGVFDGPAVVKPRTENEWKEDSCCLIEFSTGDYRNRFRAFYTTR